VSEGSSPACDSGPVLAALLDSAVAAGVARDDVSAHDVLYAVANLCMPVPVERPGYQPQRMIAVRAAGLLASGQPRPHSG
jgi:hypothetical protein